MEIYRDSRDAVSIGLPEGYVQPATVEAYQNGVKLDTPIAPASHDADRITVIPPYSLVVQDGAFELKVTYVVDSVSYTKTEHYDVVTPLVAPASLAASLNVSAERAAELERHARHVINEYTGQTFGYSKGILMVKGSGENFVSLPSRLIKIANVSAGDTNYVGAYHIIDDGWAVRAVVDNDLTIKMAPPEEAVYVTNGVIRVPNWYSRVFHENTVYAIDGEWGYASVPESVKQAAVLLAGDFDTAEQEYRDRYVETVKAADWNMEFGDGAWRGTGNARADHLLARYRRSGMAVI